MRSFFKPEDKNVVIGISGVDYVDFRSVDPRIQHDGSWMECYPMRTSISIPKDCAEEIIAKLKSNPGLTSVNGEMTTRGIAVQEEMRQQFASIRSGK